MSEFNPTIRISEPAGEPDRLSAGLVDGLSRPFFRKFSFGPAATFLLTPLTLGLVPLLSMVRWLRQVIQMQHQQFWHLAEWMRLQSADTDAIELQKSADRIRFSIPLATLTTLFALIAAGAALMHFSPESFSVNRLYRFAIHVPISNESLIFTAAISAAAVCHWVHLLWHQQNVDRFVRWFNHVSGPLNAPEIPIGLPELGLSPIWIVGGVLLAGAGALWGLPLMLAAGAHRRYIMRGSTRVRCALADRVRLLLLQRRPAVNVPQPMTTWRVCIRPNCRAPLPSIANYCPRCGTKVAEKVNVVA